MLPCVVDLFCYVLLIQAADSSSDPGRNIRSRDTTESWWCGAHCSTLRQSEWLQYNPQVYYRFSRCFWRTK